MTRIKTNQEHSQSLLAILNDFAPTGKEQRMIVDAYHAYERDTPGGGLRFLAAALYDGLAYGNWPWVVLGSIV